MPKFVHPRTAWMADSSCSPDQIPAGEEKRDLAWSLRPIAICLRCIGVDLNWNEHRPKDTQIFDYFNRIFWLVNSILFVYTTLEWVNGLSKKWAICSFIEILTIIIETLGVYAALLHANWKQGAQLVESYQKIEARLTISQQSLKKIRFITTLAAGAQVSCVLIFGITEWYLFSPDKRTLNWAIGSISTATCRIFVPISALMFYILASVLALYFEEIKKQIDNISLVEDNLKNLISAISLQHLLICKSVRQLDNYFRIILLLSICFIFTDSINCAVYAAFYLKENEDFSVANSVWVLLKFLADFLILDAICRAAQVLKEKAMDFHQSLLSPRLQSQDLGFLVTRLMIQVRESIPKLTIAGYAIINRQLIPTLIGTTITYLIIILDKSGHQTN